jgi:pseudaminic acid synthase
MDELEFTAMVNAVRDAEKAIGTIDYNLTSKQKKGRDFARSLYVAEDVAEGEVFTEKNVRSVRPGFGLHPKYFGEILDQPSSRSYKKGDRLLNNNLLNH